MKRFLFVIAIVVLIGAAAYANRGFLRTVFDNGQKPVLPIPEQYQQATTTAVDPGAVSSTASTISTVPLPPVKQPVPTAVSVTDPFSWKGALPTSKNLAVPFLSQAPKQNWALPYQEACEEASVIMVDAFYRGMKSITPDQGDKDILALVSFEEKTLGKYLDTNAEETAQLVRSYFGYKNVVVREIVDTQDMKKAIANGFPVVIPAAGKLLDNPNFKNGGPLYHMLVIKGYTQDGRWITNDPGTRNGADFLYTDANLKESMHDWNGGDVVHGKPMALVILPN
ncbi:MAG: C39 family peptidase [bacterium]|nr:C39 family peptidase [bacterium]